MRRPSLVELVERRPSSIGMDVADEQVGPGGPGDRREAIAIAAHQRAADLLGRGVAAPGSGRLNDSRARDEG